MDIIHGPIVYKNISEAGFCLRLQVESTLSPVRRLALSIERNSVGSTERRKQSSLRNVVFCIKDRTMDNVQNCDSYTIVVV
jgi:hypothetical protein